MPLLKEPIIHDRESIYFCLAFSDLDELSKVAQLVSLFPKTQIELLDVQLRTEVKWTEAQIKEALVVIINGIQKTKIHRLDFSCSNLYQLGLKGLNELLISLPSNVKTLVLSGNHWDKLGLNSQELAEKIRAKTQIDVLFEGTDEFEHQLTEEFKKPVSKNRYQWYLPASKDVNDDIKDNNSRCVVQ